MTTRSKNKIKSLNSNIGKLQNVGKIYIERLNKLGIKNIQDLINHFPFRYEDLSIAKPIIEATPGEKGTFKGTIKDINNRRSKKGKYISELVIQDDSSSLKLIFFNQFYLNRILKKGLVIVVAGKVDYNPYFGRHIANPAFDLTSNDNSLHLGRIVPIYPETKGITSRWLRTKIKSLFPLINQIADYIPDIIKDELDLLSLDEAIRQVHFPEYKESLAEAIKRLSFDELFLISLRNQLERKKFKTKKAPAIFFHEKKTKEFVDFLPFKLTSAQKKAAWEILLDIDSKKRQEKEIQPMNRLLNGDVGSGKTVVAAIASFQVCLNKKQVAIMAPTEVLAYQHFNSFCSHFKNQKIKIELITNSYHLANFKLKKTKKISSDIVIGTHSLIQKTVSFKNLALAIIDEQHRFGVKQRAALLNKNLKNMFPHLLSMTATPIPRSLALSLYGDLDISLLDELPSGRQQTKTHLISPQKKARLYEFVRSEIKKGRQAFFICPLIEKKIKNYQDKFDFDNRKAAMEEKKKLSEKIFPEYRVGLLHGKVKAEKKEKIMDDFRKNKINILVSTSVVEVGVDVPNATVIVVEGAERFGLSQLHQFRGRVGRGNFQSYCFLSAQTWGEKTKERLEIMKSTNDGFKIAEADLNLRGPGEIYGVKQHGVLNLRFASLNDIKKIKEAKKEAEKIIALDPTLKKWPKLKKKLSSLEKEIHLE